MILGIGTLVLYGGADYPGFFADSGPGATPAEGPGPERFRAIETWRNRYVDVGLPFSIAAAAATFGWLLTLHRRRQSPATRSRPLVWLHSTAVVLAVSWQVVFIVLSTDVSAGTIG